MNDAIDLQSLDAKLEAGNVRYVKVAVTDVDGILRGKYIHIDKFKSALKKGFGFCSVVLGWDSGDVCYDHVDYTGWHNGYPDSLVHLDPGSFREVPWDRGVPFFLGNFVSDDGQSSLPLCPRGLLKKIVGDAKALGFESVSGCEFEWFNFKETPDSLAQKDFVRPEPLTPGMFGYSLLRASENQDFMHEMMDALEAFRVPLEGLHTETGPGVYEAAIQCDHSLEAADRAVLFKSSVKEIARQYGITASFMARWNASLPGCSGHIHQSLCDENGKNLFFSESSKYGMSEVFESYLAGLIHCLPDFLPMMAPTVNSFKRLVKGFWAPTSATWGVDNRTCALRVIPSGASSTRVEVRVPGADMNPYLAVSAALGAGLYGIKHKLSLKDQPVIGNGYECTSAPAFPEDLEKAAKRFKESEPACEVFGEAFVKHFATTRLWEWEQAQKAVTDWEMKRYFEII